MGKPVNKTLRIAAAFEGARFGHVAGDIVRFRGDGSPLRSLLVSIDPVQDLHGYDSPWPAGGGKQKFNIADAAINETQSVSGNTITKAYSAYNFDLLNGTTGSQSLATIKISLAAGTYTISGTVTSEGSTGIRVYAVDSDGVVAETYLTAINASTPFATFILAESGYITLRYSAREACTVSNIQIEPGSTATTYAPYSNLCPISGWSAVNVWRTGVNVWDEEWVLGYWNHSNNGAFVSNNNFFACKNKIKVLPNTAYYWVSPSVIREMLFYDSNENLISYSPYSAVASSLFITPDKCQYITFYYATAYGTTYNHDISINYPRTDQEYHAYSGTTYPIQLGQTVYGGTLDVLGGVLTVDMAKFTFDSNTPIAQVADNRDGNLRVKYTSGIPAYKTRASGICSAFPVITSETAYNYAPANCVFSSNGVYVMPPADVEHTELAYTQWLSSVGAIDVVMELATPLTIPLSSIAISALAGTNVVWADCGDVDVEYIADNGVEGGKLALLLRHRPELLIAMRKGESPQELLLAMGSRGDARPSITPVRPGQINDDEEEELRKW